MIGQILEESWERVKSNLFTPFKLELWLKWGFFFFLSRLIWPLGNGGVTFSLGQDLPSRWLPFFFILMAFIFLIGFILWLGLTYLCARGQFMVIHGIIDEARSVKEAWASRPKETLSLFLFYIIMTLLMIILAVLGMVVFLGGFIFQHHQLVHALPFIIGFGLFLVIVTLFFWAIFELTKDFVVPIMYKDQISVWKGWQALWGLFKGHPLKFLLFYVVKWAIGLGVLIAWVILGLLTCCIGWVLLIIPYIREVVFLPVFYFFRVFSLNFLSKVDANYELLPKI